MEGRRKSASTSSTRASGSWARTPARPIAVLVFPSPTLGLEMARMWRPASWRICTTKRPSMRYGSASKAVGVTRVTRCGFTLSGHALSGHRRGVTGRGAPTFSSELRYLLIVPLFSSLVQALQLRGECSQWPWPFDRDIRAYDKSQAEYYGEGYEAESPPSATDISPGDNVRETHQDRHLGEGM